MQEQISKMRALCDSCVFIWEKNKTCIDEIS